MKVNLNGPVSTHTGYGHVVTNFAIQLDKQNIDVTLWPIMDRFECLPENKDILQKMISRQDSFKKNAPCLRIYHQNSMAPSIGKGRRIGMPIFELNKFNSREKTHLLSLDEIIVNSEWAAEVVKNSGVNSDPYVVPLGYDPNVFFPANIPRSPDDKFVVLNVGKWTINKGHDVLKEIFERAFREDDDVKLWMACHNHFLNERQTKQWHDYYTSGPLGNKVRFIPWQNSQQELAMTMQNADVGLFPARAEGQNLGALEMMACGKRVIATDYSGHTEFMKPSVCDLVPIKKTELAYDGEWFFNKKDNEGEWAYIGEKEISLFAEYLRHNYENRNQDSVKIIEHASKYTWEKSTCKLISDVFR